MAGDAERVLKKEFLDAVAKRAGVSTTITTRVYEAFVAELLDVARSGKRVLLTGFGKFYPQIHAGHRVQFAKDKGGAKEIGPYPVLKFSAGREVSRSLRLD